MTRDWLLVGSPRHDVLIRWALFRFRGDVGLAAAFAYGFVLGRREHRWWRAAPRADNVVATRLSE